MTIHVLPGELRIEPPFPVEFPVSVEGMTLRVAVEWAAIARAVEPGGITKDAVEDYLRRHRTSLELAIRAHLFAHGVPLDRWLPISAAELDAVTVH